MNDDLEALRNIADPLDRARRAHLAIPAAEAIRDDAIAEASRAGTTHTAIGETLGVTRARISQILKGGPGPERAFWGAAGGRLTVALAGKPEAPRQTPGRPGIDVAVDDLGAFEALRDLASSSGVTAVPEVVAPPGFIDLNRAGLMVLCGPRHSPLIRQVLASDRNLAFERDDAGWYLADRVTGRQWRSPADSGGMEDIAYLGRLPRPDTRGDFLYAAGIHAAGDAGVIHYLTSGGLEEAWRETGRRRFSVLVRCELDAAHAVTASERVTDFYQGA